MIASIIQRIEAGSTVSQCSFAFGSDAQYLSGSSCRLCRLAEYSVCFSIRSGQFFVVKAGVWDVKDAHHRGQALRDVDSDRMPDIVTSVS